ncbi:acyl-CoA carboxylase subunit epsilon [Nonomuraea polychroma]|uniref:acyl-CoA carboxylase subunit epsilon n=1 Tax=Nonomuraea polychroma TaxID=46176 RepID=UPI003D8E9D2E
MNERVIRILRGRPTEAELAAIAAVLLMAGPYDGTRQQAAEQAPWHRFQRGYVSPGAWTTGIQPTHR